MIFSLQNNRILDLLSQRVQVFEFRLISSEIMHVHGLIQALMRRTNIV